MKLRSILSISLACLLSLAIAQKPSKQEKSRAKQVKKHVEYLSSDELQGKIMGGAGEAKAAEYIANQFTKIGLTPGNKGEYYQRMPLINMRMAKNTTSLMLNNEKLSVFSEFYPLSETVNNAIYNGKAVNVGFGIVDDGLKHDDYAGKDVSGKAVVIDLDIPNGANPHNRYMSYLGADLRLLIAESKGAKAILFHTTNEDLRPSGELAKIISKSTIPILFINKALTEDSYDVKLVVDILAMSTDANNVIGKIDNQQPYTVVVGSHYDHLGLGEKGGSFYAGVQQVHNGADASASGIAALLELAKEIKNNPKKFKNYNYTFIAFSGHEANLTGSQTFVNSTLFELSPVNYMINLDMIGRLDSTSKTLIVNGVGSSKAWNKVISKTKLPKKKIENIKTTESGLGDSDHNSFYLNGIPSLHIFTGYHNDYNKPSDDANKLNYLGEAYIIDYLCAFMNQLDKAEKLDFQKTIVRNLYSTDYEVDLGILLDYTYEQNGVRIASINENGVAVEAGINAGDIITALGDKEVKDVSEYKERLSSLQKGITTTVTISRGAESQRIEIKL